MNPSAVKTIGVLEFLVGQKQGATLTEISRALGIAVSSTHEVVSTLVDLSYVQRDQESRRFHIGLKLLDLGLAYLRETEVYAAATPIMGQVSKGLDCLTSVHVFDPAEGVVLTIAEEGGAPHLRLIWKVGRQSTLHCGAPGKVFLASLKRADVERILAKAGMPVFTANTITDPAKLREELVAVRERGYALDREEVFLGISCVAVPIVVDDVQIGALSILTSSERLEDGFIARALEVLGGTSSAIANGILRLSPSRSGPLTTRAAARQISKAADAAEDGQPGIALAPAHRAGGTRS